LLFGHYYSHYCCLLYFAVCYIIIIFYPRQSLFSAHTHTTHNNVFNSIYLHNAWTYLHDFGALQPCFFLNDLSRLYLSNLQHNVAPPSDKVNNPTTEFFAYKIKPGHCVRLTASLKQLQSLICIMCDTFQCGVVHKMSVNFTFINCVILSGVTWWKTTLSLIKSGFYIFLLPDFRTNIINIDYANTSLSFKDMLGVSAVLLQKAFIINFIYIILTFYRKLAKACAFVWTRVVTTKSLQHYSFYTPICVQKWHRR